MFYRMLWPLALASTIVYSSGGAGPQLPDFLQLVSIDKLVHFFIFGLLATLILRVYDNKLAHIKYAFIAIIVTSLFGLLDEWHQYLNPYRYFEVANWMADTLGSIVAVIAYQSLQPYKRLLEMNINFNWIKNNTSKIN